MLNLEQIAQATGGTIVVAGKGSDIKLIIREALFNILPTGLRRGTKIYRAITNESFNTLEWTTRLGDEHLSIHMDVELLKGLSLLRNKACPGGTLYNDESGVMFVGTEGDYDFRVSKKQVTTSEQFIDVVTKCLAKISKDAKPFKEKLTHTMM